MKVLRAYYDYKNPSELSYSVIANNITFFRLGHAVNSLLEKLNVQLKKGYVTYISESGEVTHRPEMEIANSNNNGLPIISNSDFLTIENMSRENKYTAHLRDGDTHVEDVIEKWPYEI